MDPIDCARMEAAAENYWLTSLLLRSDWPLSSALGDAGDVGEWWDAISIADSCALAGCRWLPMESRPDSVRDDCEDRVRKADSSAEGARPDGVCAGAGVEPVALRMRRDGRNAGAVKGGSQHDSDSVCGRAGVNDRTLALN